MAESVVIPLRLRPVAPGGIVIALLIPAALFTMQQLRSVLPIELWWNALRQPSPTDIPVLIFMDVTLPRIVVSWLVGAALGLSGVLLQQALRNPLADVTTMGVSSGAYLALTAATLFAPFVLDWGQEWVALAGGGLAACAVLLLSLGAGFSVSSIILSGLSLSLLCGALGATLTIMNHEILNTLYVWQSGSLVQNGWSNVDYLLPRLALCGLAAAVLVRPLSLFDLDEAQARALGAPAALLRASGIALGVAIGAMTVSAAGVIGFIGLAAPNLARTLGARTWAQRLLWAPLLGALLLWLADQLVQRLAFLGHQFPTGSATALLGAPLLLWLLLRRREAGSTSPAMQHPVTYRHANPIIVLASSVAVFGLCVIVALAFGRDVDGWRWLSFESAQTILPWRWPRVAAAASAGAMLAVAGTLLQRMTANPMASPEVLGVSSGAALGVILLLLVIPDFTLPAMFAAALAGGIATLAGLVALNWRTGFSSDRLLLVGVAIAGISSAFAAVLLSSGDPRSAVLLAWMSGSTFRVSPADAITACLFAVVALCAVPLTARWLDLLSVGNDAARSLGVSIVPSRFCLLSTAAGLTAMATLIVGPLSFVGLMAPHIIRMLGLQRPLQQIAATAAVGAIILVTADWLGRNMLFPWQLPAGLVAALVGAPCFLELMRRRRP